MVEKIKKLFFITTLPALLILIQILLSSKFSILINIAYLEIILFDATMILFGLSLFISYYQYTKRSINPFLTFFYWFLCIFNIFCLFMSSAQVFFFKNTMLQVFDYIINIPNFNIAIIYTYSSKLEFISNCAAYYLEQEIYSVEKKEIIIKLITTHEIIKDPNMLLINLRTYILFYMEVARSIYDSIDQLQKTYETECFHKSDFYNFFYFIRNILVIAAAFKTFYFYIPTWMLQNFFQGVLVGYIKIYLLQLNPSVLFIMTPDEFDIFCRQISALVEHNYSALYILLVLIKVMYKYSF